MYLLPSFQDSLVNAGKHSSLCCQVAWMDHPWTTEPSPEIFQMSVWFGFSSLSLFLLLHLSFLSSVSVKIVDCCCMLPAAGNMRWTSLLRDGTISLLLCKRGKVLNVPEGVESYFRKLKYVNSVLKTCSSATTWEMHFMLLAFYESVQNLTIFIWLWSFIWLWPDLSFILSIDLPSF